MEDRKRRQFKPNGQTLRIQDRKTYSHKRITRERKQLHILLACLSDLLSNCHGSTTEDRLLRPSTRSWIDKPTVWIPYIWMVGTLQLQSPECVSEVLSMREREVANLGSDCVLVLLIRLGLVFWCSREAVSFELGPSDRYRHGEAFQCQSFTTLFGPCFFT